jgi:hypothetical protein
MNRIILSTGSDKKYLDRINAYLNTIETNSNFDENYLIFLAENDVEAEVDINFSKIKISKIFKSEVEKLTYINCLQHGEFVKSDFLDANTADNDVIVFTDGDMFLQRNLTGEEEFFLRSFKDGDVYVGYNSSPIDTLLDEYRRLAGPAEMSEPFNIDLSSIKVYNTGVLAMNKKTWKKLYSEYIKLFDIIDLMFDHYAKQQWLISFIIGTMNEFNIIEMPYDIHNHTHYKSPEGTKIDEKGIVTFNDNVVLFKHKWN